MAVCPDGDTTLVALQNKDIPRKCKICLYFQARNGTRGRFFEAYRCVSSIGGLGFAAVGLWPVAPPRTGGGRAPHPILPPPRRCPAGAPPRTATPAPRARGG